MGNVSKLLNSKIDFSIGPLQVELPLRNKKCVLQKLLSKQRKRAVVACFRMAPLYNLPRSVLFYTCHSSATLSRNGNKWFVTWMFSKVNNSPIRHCFFFFSKSNICNQPSFVFLDSVSMKCPLHPPNDSLLCVVFLHNTPSSSHRYKNNNYFLNGYREVWLERAFKASSFDRLFSLLTVK